MYNDLFNENRQNKMRSFFLQELSKKGTLRTYGKNTTIHIPKNHFIAIVTEGKIVQTLYSSKGTEKILYFLQPGEIFGEIDFFGGGKSSVITKALETSTISIIAKETIEKLSISNFEAYNFFLHSISRKFRIVMFQMAGMYFNNSSEKVADVLLRLVCQNENVLSKKELTNATEEFIIFLTHQELADLIGCSRITVTKELNKFKDNKIVDLQNKKIIIKDIKKLKSVLS